MSNVLSVKELKNVRYKKRRPQLGATLWCMAESLTDVLAHARAPRIGGSSLCLLLIYSCG
jgi:hypothetical protein